MAWVAGLGVTAAVGDTPLPEALHAGLRAVPVVHVEVHDRHAFHRVPVHMHRVPARFTVCRCRPAHNLGGDEMHTQISHGTSGNHENP